MICNIRKTEVQANEKLIDEINDNKINEFQNKISENEVENIVDNDKCNLKINHKEISEADVDIDNKNISNENIGNNPQDNIPILFETKKSNTPGKKKKEDNSIEVIDEKIDNNSIFCITEGEIPLGDGDQIIAKWSFGG